MKLSKECIEAIEKESDVYSKIPYDKVCFERGSFVALTNPSIYEKAGLISLEDAFVFFHWATTKAGGHYYDADLKLFVRPSTSYEETKTISEIFQIYQDTKNK